MEETKNNLIYRLLSARSFKFTYALSIIYFLYRLVGMPLINMAKYSDQPGFWSSYESIQGLTYQSGRFLIYLLIAIAVYKRFIWAIRLVQISCFFIILITIFFAVLMLHFNHNFNLEVSGYTPDEYFKHFALPMLFSSTINILISMYIFISFSRKEVSQHFKNKSSGINT